MDWLCLGFVSTFRCVQKWTEQTLTPVSLGAGGEGIWKGAARPGNEHGFSKDLLHKWGKFPNIFAPR